MKVTIYSGIPGSGKTRLSLVEHPQNTKRFSADDFFTGQDGEYVFDPSRIGEAHAQCLRRYVEAIRYMSNASGPYDMVVDNTNASVAEIAPYAALALAYGWALEIVTIIADPEEAGPRNVHGVPMDIVRKIYANLERRELPPWWPSRNVPASYAPR